MTGKPPTPQGISALLRKAGFGKSEPHGRTSSPGYRVRKSYPTASPAGVWVTHVCAGVPDGTREQAMLARYSPRR